jgi:hypothetical protein
MSMTVQIGMWLAIMVLIIAPIAVTLSMWLTLP